MWQPQPQNLTTLELDVGTRLFFGSVFCGLSKLANNDGPYQFRAGVGYQY
jgi:hypothetical protein